MSEFLAPIHYWMYDKVLTAEKLVAAVADRAEEEGWPEMTAELSERCVRTPDQPLEEIIDRMDIHGWLQGHIDDVEGRLAVLVGALTAKHPERAQEIAAVAQSFGRERALGAGQSAAEIFRAYQSTLLNGMPCDRVDVLLSQEEDCFVWEQSRDLHSHYWEEAGADAALFVLLRDGIMRGMIEDTDYVLTHEENQYILTRKAA